jgi:hypothetical protein
MRFAGRDLLVSAVLGLAAGVWCATYGKVDPPMCFGCRGPIPNPHIAWGWTIGTALVITAIAAAGLARRRHNVSSDQP